MGKLKHTPGPWEVTGSDNHLFAVKNDDSIDSIIGEMWGHAWFKDEKRQEEKQANARLIAAAPEMFEMLIHLYVNYNLPYGGMDIETKKQFKTVIEKATGMKVDDVTKG